jgi:hypothetical protein
MQDLAGIMAGKLIKRFREASADLRSRSAALLQLKRGSSSNKAPLQWNPWLGPFTR